MIANLKKIWAILTPRERRRSLLMLGLIILMALAETGGVISIMPFLAVLGRPEIIHENRWLKLAWDGFGFHDTRDFMIALGLASIVIVVGSALFKTLTLHLINRFVHLLRHSVSARLLSRYLHQPYEFFLGRHTAELSRNVLSEVDQLLFNLVQPLSQLIAHGAVVMAMLALIFLYKPLVALGVIVVVGTLYAGIYGLVRKRLARIGRERQAANGERYQACSEVLGGIKDVKVAQAADAYQHKFNHASRQFSRHMATGETLAQSPLYMVEAVGYTGLIVLAVFFMLQRGDIAHVLPALGLFGFAAYRMLPAAQIMYRGFAKLKFSAAALDVIHRDLGLAESGAAKPGEPLTPRREISLVGIGYAYPSTPGKPVLDDFNLTIPVGSSTGIAGPTGAGKSTLMDILLGLLEPRSGTLSVDGLAIRGDEVARWQRAIGYVPQHIYLADASVAENIAFGVGRAAIDMRAVERAARAAQIHDFVANELEHGYDTPIGERGIRLSGGQRQRVGIARALYRDPPVLLMDEATSALDTATETALNAAINALAGDRTVVIIAHRQASLEACQRIVVLDSSNRQPTQPHTRQSA